MLRNISSKAFQAIKPRHNAVATRAFSDFNDEDSKASVFGENKRLENVDNAKCLNRVTLLGRVASQVHVSDFANGQMLALTLATNEVRRNKSQELIRTSEFHRIQVFSPGLIEKTKRVVEKGSRIMVEGKIHYNVRRDDQGHQTTFTNIVAENILFFTGNRFTRETEDVVEEEVANN